MVNAIEVTNLIRRFGSGNDQAALNGVNLIIAAGEFVALTGPSGAGKSTLMNQIALLDQPTEGQVVINGIATNQLSERRRSQLRSGLFGFVFQAFHLQESATVAQNAETGLLYRAVPPRLRRKRALAALARVGLHGLANRPVWKLSGGERQRVAIARAIATDATIILADEPTGNLDSANASQVMDLLEELHHSGHTVIVVTHDARIAARATRCIELRDGQVVNDTVTKEQAAAKEHVATTMLHRRPPIGRASKLRLYDLFADARRSWRAGGRRTVAMVVAVALGVGLGVATTALAQTANAQVSSVFDAALGRRVALTTELANLSNDQIAQDLALAATPNAVARLRQLSSVTAAEVFIWHETATVSSRDNGDPQSVSLVSVVEPQWAKSVWQVETAQQRTELTINDVIVGAALANELSIGPLFTSPYLWIDGQSRRVVGIIVDASYQPELLHSIVMSPQGANQLQPASYAIAELRVDAGQAVPVSREAELAWLPWSGMQLAVTLPPDPTDLRQTVEQNVRAVLITLTGVALVLAVLALTNSAGSAAMLRRPEFALRRAVGARRCHIAALVAVEATLTGLLGGVVGAYGAVLSVLGVTAARHWTPLLHPVTVALGVLGGALVGVLGGLVAARRAGRGDLAVALRSL